ncbi:hypothetical protein Acr_14g0005930 [Actinidia rufa]|uniref:Uncharacterized protein n=1 Tax=Actinidia rufa TaxID=165716 RepID=A0A7J0FSN9_9ERIC|nr:hypothetical protein Acr_14g0005930 [Actinidia rufa]
MIQPFSFLTDTNSGRAKADTSTGPSLYRKLDGVTAPEHDRDVVAINLLSTSPSRAGIVVRLSLYSKLSGVIALELDRAAMVSDDPKARRGTEGDLYANISSDSPTPVSRHR